MKEIRCCVCGVAIYMDEETYQRRIEDGKTFHCINGHSQVFRESTVEKVRKENEVLKRRLDLELKSNKEMRASINGYKGQVGRLMKRIRELNHASNT